MLERRFALESGGRNAFAATIAAGVDDVKLPLGFRLGGYAQAGLVDEDAFADGSVAAERTMATYGKASLSFGAAAWAGAQPGVSRVDVGPQIIMRTPVANGMLRASAEWRQRVAGNAAPASGPTLTVGIDF